MPHGFEYIVRPFQSPGSFGNLVIPGTPGRTAEQAHITWGAVGTMPNTKILNPSVNVTVCKETSTELERDAPVQRIIGSDGESYVDVARVQQMKLDKTETKSGQTLGQVSNTPVKLDPRIASDPGFHATVDNPNPDRCGQVWHFNV